VIVTSNKCIWVDMDVEEFGRKWFLKYFICVCCYLRSVNFQYQVSCIFLKEYEGS
jgi:hypothetical protein